VRTPGLTCTVDPAGSKGDVDRHRMHWHSRQPFGEKALQSPAAVGATARSAQWASSSRVSPETGHPSGEPVLGRARKGLRRVVGLGGSRRAGGEPSIG
jgi:hypothetical protein